MSVLVLKLVALSVKYVSKKRVWAERFGDEYVDWGLVDGMTSKNVLGGCTEWMALLSFCKWEDMMKQSEAVIQTSYPPLFILRKHMRESNLDTGDGDAWTVACKVFLLMLVQGLPSQHSLEVLTCSVFRRDTRAGCTSLLARQVHYHYMAWKGGGVGLLTRSLFRNAQAEHLFTPSDYETALSFVLGQCTVDALTLEQIHTKLQAAQEDRRLNLKMSRMTVIQGRPRLRDKVSSELKTDEKKTQVDTQLDTWDSYTGFCYKHQFPPTLSERVKSRLYFLASQTRWDWAKYVECVLPSGGAVGDKVVAHPVTQPDLQVLLRVIERLSMDGSPPFEKMTEFRKECFASFPVTHVQRMTLSQVSREGVVYERDDEGAHDEHQVHDYEFQFIDEECAHRKTERWR